MVKSFLITCMLALLLSCSKKHIPEAAIAPQEKTETSLPAVSVKKQPRTPSQKDIIPDVIIVNDKAAHVTIDGRLYYDLLGHRYWKNYKNGKYYLFNRAMYDNNAFKPPSK